MTPVSVGILGLGSCVPERILSNHDLEQMVETSDEWIVSRTGIKERRICAADQYASDLGAEAARKALIQANMSIDDIDLIIACTVTAEDVSPSVGCRIQAKLGATRPMPAFDLSAACSGLVYGGIVGAGLIQAGLFKKILVVATETLTRATDYEDRNTCVLFGDAAGAMVLGKTEEGYGLLGHAMGADGANGELILVPGLRALQGNGSRFITMNGNEVYKFATRILGSVLADAIANANITNEANIKPEDLDFIIPHQANVRILETASKKLGIPMDRFVINIQNYGNTSAASAALALDELYTSGRLTSGMHIGMVAFGGGLTYAASIWRWK